MNLTPKKLYYIMIGICAVAFVVLLVGVYGADKVLQIKAKAVREAQLDTLVLEEEQRRLSKAKSDIEKYQDLADIAKHIVPQDKDQAQTVREIVSIAGRHDIKLSSITFPSSSLGSKNADKSQLIPVKGIAGVFSIDINVESSKAEPATYQNFLDFLEALEHNRRTALVKSISLQPDGEDPSLLTFSLTLREYIKP